MGADWRLRLLIFSVLSFPPVGTSGGKLGILSSQNETEGHDVVFVCPVVTGTVSEHRWLINGSLSSSFSDVKDTISAGEIQLYFSQVSSKYNHTTIQCVVTFTSGKTEDSNNATLRVDRVINTTAIGANVTDFPPREEGNSTTVTSTNLQPPKSSSKWWIVAVVVAVVVVLILAIWAVRRWLPKLAEMLLMSHNTQRITKADLPATDRQNVDEVVNSADQPATDIQNVDEGLSTPQVEQERGTRKRSQPHSSTSRSYEVGMNVAYGQECSPKEKEPIMNTNTPGCDDPLYDNHVRQPDGKDEEIIIKVIPSTAGVENGYGGEEHSAACYIKAAHVVV